MMEDKKAAWSIMPGLEAAAAANRKGMKVYCVDSDIHKHMGSSQRMNSLLKGYQQGSLSRKEYSDRVASTLSERNSEMAANIQKIPSQGGLIGVFGADHLEGEKSLGTNLRKSGHNVQTYLEIPKGNRAISDIMQRQQQYFKEYKAEHSSDPSVQVSTVEKVPSIDIKAESKRLMGLVEKTRGGGEEESQKNSARPLARGSWHSRDTRNSR